MEITPASLQALLNGDMDNFVTASTPGGIEAQEAEGQKEFVVNQTLPKDCQREMLEKIGFIFGDDVDDIFVSVKFPDGWEKKATEHSMWSDLLDDKGRKRGGIFYKAAFYDRNARMTLNCRYSFSQDYDIDDGIQYFITDCGEVMKRLEKICCEKYSEDYWHADKLQSQAAKMWLNNYYPDWRNELAYWD